jgi:DNA primase
MSYFTKEENFKVLTFLIASLGLKTKKHLSESDPQIFITCPAHSDKTPSCSVNVERGIAHCFSCGGSWTLNQLSKEHLGKSAFKILGKHFDEDTEFLNFLNKAKEPEDHKKLPQVQISFDGPMIRLNDLCVTYLLNRGITLEIAREFKMRYMEKGFINGTPFSKRLLIPVIEQTHTLAYEGRDVTGLSLKKVLYPAGSSVNTLYDIDNLKRDEPLYVVEGLMDLAILRQDPYFKNSTSLFGSNPTRRKAALLSDFKQIVWIPDNDKAGYDSVTGYSEMIDLTKTKISILRVPSFCKDVGDFPKNKFNISEKKDQWISNIVSLQSFKTNLISK